MKYEDLKVPYADNQADHLAYLENDLKEGHAEGASSVDSVAASSDHTDDASTNDEELSKFI